LLEYKYHKLNYNFIFPFLSAAFWSYNVRGGADKSLARP